MRKLLLSLVLVFFAPVAQAAEMTGREIMDESANRHELPFESEVLEMRLSEGGAVFETRLLRRYSLKGAEDLFKYLTVFDDPAGVKGVALLTWQNRGTPDDQWTYLPAVSKKLKRTAGSSRRKPFLGTNFTYEDMSSDNRDNFVYERLADETLDGQAMYMVSAVPANEDVARDSGYGRRLFAISQENFYVLKITFFDQRQRELKVQTSYELESVTGQTLRPRRVLMKSSDKDFSTELTIIGRKITEDAVTDSMMGHQWIMSGRYMQP